MVLTAANVGEVIDSPSRPGEWQRSPHLRSERQRSMGEGGHWRPRHAESHCGRMSMDSFFACNRRTATVVVQLVAVIATGCGESKHRSRTVPASRQQAIGKPRGSSRGSSVSTARRTERSGLARSGGRAHGTVPVIGAGRVIRSFSGTGNRRIGSLSEKTAIVLQWRTAGRAIQLFTVHGFVLVDSHAATGRVRLARGGYPALRVATRGSWTVQLRAAL
jgi:hypothetical protein